MEAGQLANMLPGSTLKIGDKVPQHNLIRKLSNSKINSGLSIPHLSLSTLPLNFTLFVWMCCLNVCLRRPEEGSDPMELGLEMAISCSVGAGNQTCLGHQEKQPVLLTIEVSLLSPLFYFYVQYDLSCVMQEVTLKYNLI